MVDMRDVTILVEKSRQLREKCVELRLRLLSRVEHGEMVLAMMKGEDCSEPELA